MTAENTPSFTEDQTLEEKLKVLEKANRGLTAEVIEGREEKRELKERLANIENSLTSAAEDNGDEKPEDKVNRLANDPDGYIQARVDQVVTPLMRELQQLRLKDEVERARKWVAKREKIDPDDVDEKLGADLARIGKERGLVKLNPEEGIKASYEILLQERREKDDRESSRNESINNHGTENVRIVPRTKGRFTREDIAGMSIDEYTKNEAAIKQQMREGKLTYDIGS